MDEIKQAKKSYSRIGWCYLAGTAVINILQIAFSLFVKYYKPEWQESMSILLIASSVTVYAIGLPLILLLAYRMPKTVPERHKMKWWQFLLAFIMCYALIYMSNLIGTMITTIIGMVKGSAVQNNLVNFVTGGNMFLNFVLMVIVAPIMEEYIFRKVLVDRTIRYGQGLSIALSGLMFGLFHGNLNQFAYAVVLGAFFAFLYIKTGNIKITMLMHAIVNFMGGIWSAFLLKMLHYDELLAADMENVDEVMNLVLNNLAGWLLFGVYALLLMAVVLAGIILLIVFHKRFAVGPGEIQIPKGERFRTLILNPGMGVFCIVWIIMIIVQLFQ